MKRVVAVLLLCLLTAAGAVAEEEPEPYSPEEFPQWALDVRRAEIVALGVYPIAYLFTTLAYDLFRFTRESIDRGAVATEYAPLFFAPPDAPGYDRDERRGVFVASISVSALVAVADYLLGRAEGSDTDDVE
jgi:hypothetical protein